MTRLAVLGSPIAHSKSPALHAAAYRELGLDWTYEAIEVTDLATFLEGLDDSWRGLSATMPLKRQLFELADTWDDAAALTGGANTLLLGDDERRVFNTDVGGIIRAFARSGVTSVRTATILGGGATAASMLVSLAGLGAESVLIRARTPARVADLERLGRDLGLEIAVRPLDIDDRSLIAPDVVVSTLPGGAQHDLAFAGPIRERSVLFEVAYDPWPSALVSAWQQVGGRVIDGLDMLIEQALLQVRVFVSGDPDAALPDEQRVLSAMRASVTR